jgi:hypothetical protein
VYNQCLAIDTAAGTNANNGYFDFVGYFFLISILFPVLIHYYIPVGHCIIGQQSRLLAFFFGFQ